MAEIIQGSAQWLQARLGKVTASRVADIIARTKSGPAASRKAYHDQLVAERLTGKVADSYSSADMRWGIDTEPEARDWYSFYTGIAVQEVGFVDHPTIADSGASPDGLVGADGLVEIKCPKTATHINTLRVRKVPSKYVSQIQWQLACTGRQWCDYVSFDPRMPEELRQFVQRIERDGDKIEALSVEVRAFLAEVQATVDEIYNLNAPPLDPSAEPENVQVMAAG